MYLNMDFQEEKYKQIFCCNLFVVRNITFIERILNVYEIEI